MIQKISQVKNSIKKQSSYLSQISQIIFVEKKLSCGEILGNFGEILGNFEKFWEILRIFGKFWEILGDFATICALSCGEKLSPKSTFVEQKMTKIRSALHSTNPRSSLYRATLKRNLVEVFPETLVIMNVSFLYEFNFEKKGATSPSGNNRWNFPHLGRWWLFRISFMSPQS